jgi:hypothetical protein
MFSERFPISTSPIVQKRWEPLVIVKERDCAVKVHVGGLTLSAADARPPCCEVLLEPAHLITVFTFKRKSGTR